MTGHVLVVAFVLVVVALLCAFLFFTFSGAEHRAVPAQRAIKPSIGVASASGFERVMFTDRDFLKLRATAKLNGLSQQFRRDRLRIALLWLSELRGDVHGIREYRRFMVRNGLRVSFWDEIEIGFGACMALFWLGAARYMVFICGPFVFMGGIRMARVLVERLSIRAACLVSRAPLELRSRLEQRRTRYILSRKSV